MCQNIPPQTCIFSENIMIPKYLWQMLVTDRCTDRRDNRTIDCSPKLILAFSEIFFFFKFNEPHSTLAFKFSIQTLHFTFCTIEDKRENLELISMKSDNWNKKDFQFLFIFAVYLTIFFFNSLNSYTKMNPWVSNVSLLLVDIKKIFWKWVIILN